MFKRAIVVMLATNEKAIENTLYFQNGVLRLSFGAITKAINKNKSFSGTGPKHQHLYFTSDEEIKENDLIMAAQTDSSYFVTRVYKSSLSNILPQDRKIIATTQPYMNLPQPSLSFIQKYIEEYNKDNVITDVMVEYEEFVSVTRDDILNVKGIAPRFMGVKVNSKDNTITIKKIKDDYTLQEVKELCKSAFITASRVNDIDYFQWEKENLY